MSMLAFMPWWRIERVYEVGDIAILPFKRHVPIDGVDDTGQCLVHTILAAYKTIEGRPVDRAALVRYAGKSLLDDLSEEDRAAVHELVTLACFCGLAKREYFNSLGPYCNSDCFALYIQKFDKADFTAITTRRREGRTWSTWRIDDIAIAIPVHCHTVREVTLDVILLTALADHAARATDEEWAKWQNALTCFNQANTDSDNIRHQVEWVLLCSAFEHILGAKSEAKDVAARFSEVMVPNEPLLVRNASRRSDRWGDNGQALRYEWMREFYRIRGDFAHGKLNTRQPAVWNPLEHLVLATIAFPLVVKRLLQNACVYRSTNDDQAQIEAFEKVANTADFLNPPPDQKNSLDSHWSRLVIDAGLRLAVQRAVEECEAKGLLPREDKGTAVEGDASGRQGE
ncbi:MAG: hypothetical protein ACREXK_09715 [Gammaproteobacteria bacterium]